jgi:hypothetical protein
MYGKTAVVKTNTLPSHIPIFEEAGKVNPRLQAEFFEVVFDEYSSVSSWYDGSTNPIGEFLMTFEGLEELTFRPRTPIPLSGLF